MITRHTQLLTIAPLFLMQKIFAYENWFPIQSTRAASEVTECFLNSIVQNYF